ncbi:hypothetical protein SAMN05421810_104212 [Amycolatopsis arida]|uniref:XRE family transcriptional regulator n=2 Tax=Amycolatopsis arida TaxID=587909 RepID=A0A1I5V2Z5_9PSEU|nr:hypothetical protein CLV69_106211 [Amycolatopsis arida]SFQ01875.1 hypothetical protein SAMN05421810_104212 [Amycolatopsis arida]
MVPTAEGPHMDRSEAGTRRPRTVLEQQIRQVRRLTLNEFVDYAERFAREHDERGTLSLRHLERLVSGRGPNGKPIGRPLPATCRLLERIFGMSTEELLSPADTPTDNSGETELRRMIRASARVDDAVIALLRDQLATIRRLDRQLGALIAHQEVLTKVEQVTGLLGHSVTPRTREQLAALLSELCSLAGWQALDSGRPMDAWRLYERGKAAARESGRPAFEAYAVAEQAFVLLDIGEHTNAVDALAEATTTTGKVCSPLLRAWLSAARGEALAAAGRHTESLRAFDRAAALASAEPPGEDGPYVALDAVHLTRWRGHALALLSAPEAVDVLTAALDQLDPTFTRAETALRVDLTAAHLVRNEREQAAAVAQRAATLAAEIGSTRQQRRLFVLTDRLSSCP